MRIILIGLAGLLASCSTIVPDDSGQPSQGSAAIPAKISYSTGPCFGTCPMYSVTVSANGQGQWEGQKFVAVEGERSFTVSAQQMAEFAAVLQPFRPNGMRSLVTQEECGNNYATDMPSVDIVWTGMDGREDRLSYYYGCDGQKYAAMAEALRRAPDRLPIKGFIGK